MLAMREIRQVAVIGAGTMGHGIAQVAAQAGYDVTLLDTTADVVQNALDRIRENLDEGVRRQKLTQPERDGTLTRLIGAHDLSLSLASADLIIEAVPERLDLKASLLARVDRHASPDAIVASNTSSLSITDIQRATAHPGRVVGLHFFNPVHILKLVEVVRGADTDADVVTASVEFAKRLGKEPIVVRDSPGFASSRLGLALGLEAMRMLEQGVATAADIDKAMELGYRHPMGPLKLTDLVGLDVRLDIADYLFEKLGSEAFRAPDILRQHVAAGRLGKKSGQGFYDWTDNA
jgi:3-hydroxybutyryl-CoA dehydrogenase